MTSTPTKPVDNVVIATKGLHDRNINILAGMTVENKGKLITCYGILIRISYFIYKRSNNWIVQARIFPL